MADTVQTAVSPRLNFTWVKAVLGVALLVIVVLALLNSFQAGRQLVQGAGFSPAGFIRSIWASVTGAFRPRRPMNSPV